MMFIEGHYLSIAHAQTTPRAHWLWLEMVDVEFGHASMSDWRRAFLAASDWSAPASTMRLLLTELCPRDTVIMPAPTLPRSPLHPFIFAFEQKPRRPPVVLLPHR